MTAPDGAAGQNPDIPYVVGSTGIGGLKDRTRTNVTAQLNAQKFPGAKLPSWNGKKVDPNAIDGFDATKVTSGTFADAQVPSVGQLRDAIRQGYSGVTTTGATASQIKAIFADIAARLTALEHP